STTLGYPAPLRPMTFTLLAPFWFPLQTDWRAPLDTLKTPLSPPPRPRPPPYPPPPSARRLLPVTLLFLILIPKTSRQRRPPFRLSSPRARGVCSRPPSPRTRMIFAPWMKLQSPFYGTSLPSSQF
ncbi:hypothetical protein AX14_010204, partial [Amanita brunnescens Koide BX004]